MDTEPFVMTSFAVVNEALIPRMVRDMVAQRRIPSFCSGRGTPLRFSVSNQSYYERCAPERFPRQDVQKTGGAVLYFRQYLLIEWLQRFGDAIDPQRQCPPLYRIGDGRCESLSIHVGHCCDSARFFRAFLLQRRRGDNFGGPFFECRPARGKLLAPGSLRPRPQSPSLLDTKVPICVVHQGIEPPRRLYLIEMLCRDPFFKRLPDRASLPKFTFLKKSRASRAQFGADDTRQFTSTVGNGSNPQDKAVPLYVLAGADFQLPPRHEKSLMEGSLFPVEPDVENEIFEVPSTHPQPVSGGGSRNSLLEFLYFSNSEEFSNSPGRMTNLRTVRYSSDGEGRGWECIST